MRVVFLSAAILAAGLGLATPSSAQTKAAGAAAAPVVDTKAAVDKYCVGCHNDKLKTANLTLENFDFAHIADHADKAELVIRKVRAGLMPPNGMPRPDAAVLDGMVGWMETELDRTMTAKLPPPGIHRLNRTEYTNAIRDVLALEVVTASGEIIRTGTRAKKSSAGYDLTRLFVGSEGTLGIMTEITVRLYPLPEAVSAATCSFPSVAEAVNTTIALIQMGVPIARVELIDANTVRMVNAYSKTALREEPMLLMEFHGSPASVQEQAETVQQIATEQQGQAFEWVTTPEERTRLWTARHHAYFAALTHRPGCRIISTDTCVPISRLADCLLESVAEADASGIPYFLVGHVGDGNFHFGYAIDPESNDERARAEDLNLSLVQRAIRLGGTCTGEHGIGLHKMDFLLQETGAGAVQMMRTIKHALDPHNLMNPGKIMTW